ncbi:MAG: hypothetical protein MJ252_14130, partial [archaeon]|nr:hypothetical protein [archaeon]
MNTVQKLEIRRVGSKNIKSKRQNSASFASNKLKSTSLNKIQQHKKQMMKCNTNRGRLNNIYKITTTLAQKEKDIEELQDRIEKLTKDINDLQVQKMNLNKKLADINSIKKVGLINNDTGSNFPSSPQIIQTWSDFAKGDIINNFLEFEDYPEIIFHLTQELFILVKEMIIEMEDNYYHKIADILHIELDNNKNSKNYLQIKESLSILLRENLETVFNDEEYYNKFIEEYTDFFNKNVNKCNEDFNKMIKNKEFQSMVQNVKMILLF